MRILLGLVTAVIWLGYWIYSFLVLILSVGVPVLAIYYLGERVVPLIILIFKTSRILFTCMYLSTKFYKDKTLTFNRLYNPEQFYLFYLETWEDRFSKIVLSRIPSIRDKTDYGKVPLPQGLSEIDKLKDYFQKTWVWSLIVMSFCLVWLLNDEWRILPYATLFWGLSCLGGSLVLSLEKRNPYNMKVTRRRGPIVRKSPIELAESLTLGWVSRSVTLNKRRAKKYLGGFLASLLIYIIYIIARGYFTWL